MPEVQKDSVIGSWATGSLEKSLRTIGRERNFVENKGFIHFTPVDNDRVFSCFRHSHSCCSNYSDSYSLWRHLAHYVSSNAAPVVIELYMTDKADV